MHGVCMASALLLSFYQRPTLVVARELIGKTLARKENGIISRYSITEVEAYDGPHDRASHAWRGETPRNAPMFKRGGRWYVYFVYGMYWMLNVVTGPAGYPAAVLIRSLQEIEGPGRLTRALGITKKFDDQPIRQSSGLWIEEGREAPEGFVQKLPRVGVAYAGPAWSRKPYRFILR